MLTTRPTVLPYSICFCEFFININDYSNNPSTLKVMYFVLFYIFYPVDRVRSRRGKKNLISILGLGVRPLSVLCPVLSLVAVLTLC